MESKKFPFFIARDVVKKGSVISLYFSKMLNARAMWNAKSHTLLKRRWEQRRSTTAPLYNAKTISAYKRITINYGQTSTPDAEMTQFSQIIQQIKLCPPAHPVYGVFEKGSISFSTVIASRMKFANWFD
ncbi:hypothetical protein PENTCL1PPCAC_1606 [Pristionchus entomophagus]|uniref:SET domain-containing protein n=1 Tax=Pristionchus entomophagus TaxID=358040 RepID=A0AAV5SIG1_9BILA|nr:hypothetical protein PENTCL1PPCAC_1606 [Pristionchus entomophagus]